MALLTGIGDFFRGAFGEDAEEKKRRKQREAQEAAARKKQAAAPRPQPQQNQQQVLQQGLNPKKPAPVVQQPKLFQAQPPAAKPPVVASAAPRVQPQPKPVNYQDLGGIKDVGDYYGSDLRLLQQEMSKGDKADIKRVEGLKKSLDNRRKELEEYQGSKGKFNVAETTGIPEDETKKFGTFVKQKRQTSKQLQKDQTEPLEISAGNGNKAKFTVAQYAQYLKSQPKEQQTQILKGLTQQAAQDKGSQEMLKGLERNGVLEGDLGDFYQGFINKSGGGLLRAGQRLGQTGLEVLDKVLPGQDQAPLERWDKAADATDEIYKNDSSSYTRSGKSGQSVGTATKAGIDIAALFGGSAPANAAGKVPKVLGEGGRWSKILGNIIKEAPGSLTGTAISAAQTRGKGEEQNLAKDAAIGMAIDAALPGAGSIFRKLFRGGAKNVDEAAELAQAQLKRKADVDALATKETEKEIDELQAWNQENVNRQLRGEEPLPRPVQTPAPEVPEAPAYARQGQELPSTTQTRKELVEVDNTLQRLKEADLKKQLADAIRKYPQYKDELIKGFQVAKFGDNFDNIPAAKRLVERKAELENLIKQSDDLAAQGQKAVADQAAQVDEAVQAQQAVNADVAAEQAAKTAPVENVKVDTPAGTTEVEANNAYTPGANTFSDVEYTQGADTLVDSLMTRMGFNLTRKERKNAFSQLFGAIPRAQQAITSPLSDLTNKALTAAGKSKNSLTAGIAQSPRNIWSRFGMTDNARASLDSLEGIRNTATDVGLRIARRRNETVKQLLDSGQYNKEQLTEAFQRVFESPEFLARKYGDATKITPESLPPQLKQIVDEQIELNKIRNRLNFETGVIDEAAYFQGQDGMHTPRVYGFDFTKGNKSRKGFSDFDATAGITRKELSEIPDDIFETAIDPLTAQDIRFQQALINKGRLDAIENIKAQFGAFDTPPNKGFTQLKGKQYGELDGKFVDNQVAASIQGSPVFKSKLGQTADSLLDTWRESPLGTIDRFVKQTKTVGSVGTHVGNIGSNVTFFSGGAGVDPATALFRGLGGARSLVADASGKVDPDIFFLRKSGIIGSDTGRALNGIPPKELIKVESLLTEAENLSKRNPNKATKLFSDAWSKLQDVYGGTDDAFKVGIFRELKARGYSDEMALRRVREQFQNYDNVGGGVQMLADSPVMGKPFARFIPELARIAKNSAKNNPLGVGAGLAGVAVAGDKLSEMADETEEERALRENALGQTKLPGGISLNLPVGDSSVNIARSVGLNFPMDTNRDPNTALLNQMSPAAIPVREDKGGNTVFAPEEVVSSMAFNPIARMFANRDFMGRRITDPENTVRWEGNGETRHKYENPDGTPMDKDNGWANRARTLAMSYLPGSSEVDAGIATARGKDDYYGKQRSIPEAVGRMFGIKVESNNEEAREKRQEQEQYFGDKLPQIQSFLKENPDLTGAYWELKNTARDRNTEVSQNDIVSPERYKVIASDKTGRLFNFLKTQAIQNAKEKGEQVDPLYTLPPDEANQVIALKSMYTGDDTKFQQLLYKQPWFKAYKDAERAYWANRPEQETFEGAPKTNARPEQWYALSDQLNDPDTGVESRFPLVQRYNAEIEKFADYDSQERKNFTKNWYNTYGDTYEAQSAAHKAAQLDIVNKMREIEGAPPLTPEIWAGKFETDSDKRFGFGGGGGGARSVNTLTELTNYGDSVKRYEPIEAQAMPNAVALFQKLMAGSGGGKAKPKLGASARGQ